MRAMLVMMLENARLAGDALRAHKFRSLLTVLGVFIGVLVVVAVAAVLNGFRQSVVDQVEQFGTNNIYIYRLPFVNVGRMSRELRTRKPLRLDDAWAIRDQCPSVEAVSPGIRAPIRLGKARYRDEEMDSPRLTGVFPDDVEVANRVLASGRFFSDQENEHRAPVCVLGDAVVEALFPSGTPVGKEILIDGRKYSVIGTLEKRKEGPFGSQNEQDAMIMAPYWTIMRHYPGLDDHFIAARAVTDRLDQAIDEIHNVLRRQRKVRWDEDNNYEVGTADSIIRSFDDIVFATLVVMFLLSTVGFMVGGVGVMNIMLVSVRERTREIGLRKALGARSRDVMAQFLTEAVTLCLLGGGLGLLAGEGLLQLAGSLVPGLPVDTPLWARVFAFAGSGGVGLFFGLWPAWKAARLDPIEALRFE